MPPSVAGGSGGKQPGGGDVGAELGQGPGLARALQGAGLGGGPFPDPRGGVGREVGVEPGHAVPVRDELHPPVRRTLGMACLDAHRVVAFAPGACLHPEPARHKVPGPAPPGRIRDIGVQEMRLQPRRPGRIKTGGFIDHDPGVLPGNRPRLQSLQGQRQRRRQHLSVGQEGGGGPFTDRQDTRDLGDHSHLLRGAFLRRRHRRSQRPGNLRVLRGQPDLHRRGPGLQPRHFGHPVQAGIRQLPQQISTRRISLVLRCVD